MDIFYRARFSQRFERMTPFPGSGLYAITDPQLIPGARFSQTIAAVVRGGARAIQYRDKSDGDARRERQARILLALCREANVPLIVNDDVPLARRVGADGVHLGADDMPLLEARRVLGRNAIIGVSCYASLDRAQDAMAAGADYVAFGRFFPSSTKPEANPAPVALLDRARAGLSIPIVAIGGITADNGRALLEAGADMLAVIDGVFGQPDPAFAARAFRDTFD